MENFSFWPFRTVEAPVTGFSNSAPHRVGYARVSSVGQNWIHSWMP
jgi:hypothetical protein